ncbi:hypothetical protein [Helicobacter vulpis]|uniref:hypothetical protein n=1 Tax=Helicobacter vulpis TaxID=2316076 RepID=UPI0013CDE203|nr:hypothetical protein [Helicobacter vulpis]
MTGSLGGDREQSLILYNDYYQNDVIKLRLDVLKKERHVAFGKIRPKSKDKEHNFLAIRDHSGVFKSKRFLQLKKHLITFNLGDYAYKLHHTSLDNILYAAMEYQENRKDPLYDFSAVMVRYSKILEQEMYHFLRNFAESSSHLNLQILTIHYLAWGNQPRVLGNISKIARVSRVLCPRRTPYCP